ncbi:hypothetical protein D3C81_2039770 [compost metagenome]
MVPAITATMDALPTTREINKSAERPISGVIIYRRAMRATIARPMVTISTVSGGSLYESSR